MRADRLIALVLLLQHNGRTTARELAERLEVSERTIYRDLDALSTAGIPIYAERGPGGGCALMDGYQTTLTGLTPAEVRALFVGGRPRLLAALGLQLVHDAALRKLEAALPVTAQRGAEQVRWHVLIMNDGRPDRTQPVAHLRTIQEALWRSCTLHVTYHAAGIDGLRKDAVDPYGLVVQGHTWYMVGVTANEVQAFPVSTLHDVSLMDEHVVLPAAFDLRACWMQLRAQLPQKKLKINMFGRIRTAYARRGGSKRERLQAAA